MANDDHSIDAALASVADEATGETTTIGQILDGLQRRGFGPFITLLSLFACTPVGAIPGLPAIIGAALILFSVQLLFGRRKPWFPSKLQNFRVSTAKLHKSIGILRPPAQWIGKLMKPRLVWLASGLLPTTVIALAVTVNAALMIIFGFVPLFPFVVGLPIFLFGLGLTTRDGLVTALGYAVMGGAIWFLATRSGGFF